MSAKKASAKNVSAKKKIAEKKSARTKGTAAKAKRPSAPRVGSALLDALVKRATAVRENAHAPYSGYLVGAAIATKSGRTYVGCNVENASLGATICAERGALMQMVAAGDREPIACAVVTRDGGSPCGICRQVLSEFARDLPIVLVGLETTEGEIGQVRNLADLLPLAFDLR